MRHMIKSFNDLKLRNKFFILYVLCVFIPIIFTNVFFYNVTTTNIRNQKMIDVNLTLNQVTNEFNMLVAQAVGVSSNFYTDTRLYDFFETEYDSIIDYIEAYNQVLVQYNSATPLYNSIQEISFYTDNSTLLFAGGVHEIDSDVLEESWYQRLSEVNYPVLARQEFDSNEILFSLYHDLDFYRNLNGSRKILRIDLNLLAIYQVFNNVTLQGNLYLLNEDREIEFTNDNSIDWRNTTIEFEEIDFSAETIILNENSFSHNYLENWTVAGTVSEDEIMEELINSRRFILVLSAINFILPTFIIVFITRTFHVRLDRILKHMKKIEHQNFETIPYDGGKDEIGELTSEFNTMSNTIKTLINKVYLANIQKKDLELKEKQAQLSALQSQINPHFLFNALETIRMRSLIKNEKETAKIIQNMAKIFRNSLTWGRDWVSVENELTLIKSFLEIQEYRFGDKLKYTIDVEPDALECVIPNLVFLPFVENASIHGIEPLKGQGTIDIKIKKKNNTVEFSIADNGVGMDAEKVNSLLVSLEEDDSMGENVGIKNVYYRLKLYYNEDFKLSIKSTKENGTIITIVLKCNDQLI